MTINLDQFRESLRKRIEDRANQSINQMGAIRFRPPQVAAPMGKETQAVAMPTFGMEEIALAHTLYQAEAQVLAEIIGVIDEEYRRAVGEPIEPNDPVKAAKISKQATEQKKGVY